MNNQIGAGRPRKAAKLKELQGTFRAGREVQTVNDAPSITPTCPSSMTDAQKIIWNETVRLLMPLGLLHPEHEAILTLYCTARTTYNALGAVIAIEGVAVGGEPHKLLSAHDKAGKSVWLYATHLGITPLMRAKLNIGTKMEKKVNPFDILKAQMDD